MLQLASGGRSRPVTPMLAAAPPVSATTAPWLVTQLPVAAAPVGSMMAPAAPLAGIGSENRISVRPTLLSGFCTVIRRILAVPPSVTTWPPTTVFDQVGRATGRKVIAWGPPVALKPWSEPTSPALSA